MRNKADMISEKFRKTRGQIVYNLAAVLRLKSKKSTRKQQLSGVFSITIRAGQSLISRKSLFTMTQRLEAFCDDIDVLGDEELSNQCVLFNREFHIRLAMLSKTPFLVSTMANTMGKVRVAMAFDTHHI